MTHEEIIEAQRLQIIELTACVEHYRQSLADHAHRYHDNLVDPSLRAVVTLAAPAAPREAPEQSVPTGWVVVPIKPTLAMVQAGATVDTERESAWAAYLAAAPTPPAAAPAPIQSAEFSEDDIKAARDMGTFGSEYNDAERLKFEAYMTGHCWGIGPFDVERMTYGDIMTRQLFAVWRDRAALARLAAPAQASSEYRELVRAAIVDLFQRMEKSYSAEPTRRITIMDMDAVFAHVKALGLGGCLDGAAAPAAQTEQAKPTDLLTAAQVIEFGATLIGHASDTDGMDDAEGKAWVRARLLEWLPVAAQAAKPTEARELKGGA